MEKTLISYSLSGRKNALEITRKIYGYIECSNNNKYQYDRKGILSNIEYEKIARSCFWINPKDKDQVIKELLKLKLKLKIIDIIIKPK
jgi:hypothetical protein